MPEYSSTIIPADSMQLPAMNGSSGGNFTLASLKSYILAELGQANGIATLDSNGKLTPTQIPDSLDDVLVYTAYANFPSTGEEGKLYVDQTNLISYIWIASDSAYSRIGLPLVQTVTSGDTTHAPSSDAVYNKVLTEQTARENADSNLQTQITTNYGEIQNIKNALEGTVIQTNTDSTQKNTKTITNANEILPWALLNRVGARAVSWNQQCNFASFPNSTTVGGVTYTKGTDKLTFSASGETRSLVQLILDDYSLVAGHRYLLLDGLMGKDYSWTGDSISLRMTFGTSYAWSAKGYAFFTPTTSVSGTLQMIIGTAADLTNPLVVVPQLFDLTAMGEYDSTKTDAQNIANFRAKFPASYYPYNAGRIIPLNPSGFKVVEKNKWDEDARLNYFYNPDGTGYTANSYISSRNIISVTPNTDYYFKIPYSGSIQLLLYNIGGNISSYTNITTNSSYTIPSGVYGIKFSTRYSNSAITAYNHDILICLNSVTDKTYEAYSETTIDTSFTSDYKYVNESCHDYSENVLVDGQKMREEHRIGGQVNLGNLNWSSPITSANAYRMRSSDLRSLVKKPTGYSTVANILCARYASISATDTYLEKMGIAIDVEGDVIVYDPSYNTNTSMDAFKTAMNGVMLYYELATPSTPTLHDPIPNFPCEDGTTITAITPQTELVNAIDVPSTIAYMTKINS